MPRLSVVVPHRRDDQRLESTLLSILENRPTDCEVIVVHDGSYSDPYDLADEVVYVDTEPNSDVVSKLNAGLMAACAPYVSFVLDGVTVPDQWADASLEILEDDDQVASVAVGIQRKRTTSFGLSSRFISDARQLRRGDVLQKRGRETCASAELTCGTFRKSVLLALDGFAHKDLHQAELDFAYAVERLQLTNVCDFDCVVGDENTVERCGFAQVAGEHEVIRVGMLAAALDLPLGILQCPGSAMGWFHIQAGASTRKTSLRIKAAQEQLAARHKADTDATYRFSPMTPQDIPRRAA